jgi:hypothetical protein
VAIRKNIETFQGTTLQGKSKMSNISPKSGSLGVIIRSYKSAVSRWAGLNGHKDLHGKRVIMIILFGMKIVLIEFANILSIIL